MKEICKNCDREPYCMYPCGKYLDAYSCEWCGGQIVKESGCWRCTKCGWQSCGS